METKIEKELRFLKAYALIAALLFGVFAVTAFTGQSSKQKFTEIDVGRINVVEKGRQAETRHLQQRAPT